MSYKNGELRLGNWKDGKSNGYMVRTFPEDDDFGRAVFVGNWTDGFATLIYQDGTFEEGSIMNRAINYTQDYILFPQGTRFLGQLNTSEPSLDHQGTWVFHENSQFGSFTGEVENGHLRKGELKWKNSGKYVGDFYGNMPDGSGTFSGIFNGTLHISYSSEWRRGRPKGNATFEIKYGSVGATTEGSFEDDTFLLISEQVQFWSDSAVPNLHDTLFPGWTVTIVGENDSANLTKGIVKYEYNSPELLMSDTSQAGISSLAEAFALYFTDFTSVNSSDFFTRVKKYHHKELTLTIPRDSTSVLRQIWLTGEEISDKSNDTHSEKFFKAPNGFAFIQRSVLGPNPSVEINVTYSEEDAQKRLALQIIADQKGSFGTLTWRSGAMYAGQFAGELSQGQGSYFYPDGRKFEGQWLNGKRNGHGTLFSARNEVLAEGEWEDGELVG